MEEAKPVVITKPVRGREMLSKKGPLDKVAPAGSVEPEHDDKKQVETYYEGYVDGQLFLVPDSNLEAMKDMINFKMRPKTSIRYKHQTSYDIQYYDQFTEKLNELLAKIDDFQESADFELLKSPSSSSEDRSSDEEHSSEEKYEEEKEEKGASEENILSITNQDISNESVKSNKSVKSQIHDIKSEIVEELKKKYLPEEERSSSTILPPPGTQPATEIKTEVDEKPDLKSQSSDETQNRSQCEEVRIRFFISGHFKDGEKPIYIVQEHEAENDIFKDQKLDFVSSQKHTDANMFISGKLYSENILVESEGRPLYLDTKPEKIIIGAGKGEVFNDSFEHIFEKDDCCIQLKGKFIKSDNGKITPSLAFCVTEKNSFFQH